MWVKKKLQLSLYHNKTNNMESLSRRALSFLSLLVIVGVLSMPLFRKTNFIIIPMIMCLIGGIAFGTLVRKTYQNKD